MIPNRLWTFYISLLITAFVCLKANLIPKWGMWYSNHLPYRWQTEQLLKGKVAFTPSPSGMAWDLAWGSGTVQQVWGLGVPIWRLPFEALAKVIGLKAFPDRFAFALALFGVAYLVNRFQELLTFELKGFHGSTWAWLGVLPLLLFPPFIALCSSRFLVYEEAASYGFLASLILLIWTAWLWVRPRASSFLLLALFSGLISFVRPTLGVYGLASIAVSSLSVFRKNKFNLFLFSIGCILYLFGILLLLTLNRIRFGSIMEFGYSLNINSMSAMAYASRFDNPFQTEPFFSSIKELFGLLFFCRSHASIGNYQGFVFPGQSATFRWREMYFSTFDVFTLIMVVTTWIWLLWRVYRHLRSKEGFNVVSVLEAVALWTLLPVIPLGIFYARFPFISSRYIFDFAPAFAGASWIFFYLVWNWSTSRNEQKKGFKAHLVILMILWWGAEITTAKNTPNSLERTWDWHKVQAQMEEDQIRGSIAIPDVYTNCISLEKTGIPFNGAGWNTLNGDTEACVSLFVNDPDCIAIEVAPTEGAIVSEVDYNCIRVKIGLENLRREQTVMVRETMRILFRGPERRQYQKGVQLVSIAMMSPQELNTGNSRFRLLKVAWHCVDSRENAP